MEKEFSEKIGTDYTLEELLPLFSKLAEKYTSFESSSITNGCAQMLMDAIFYCIREYENLVGEDPKAATGENPPDTNSPERKNGTKTTPTAAAGKNLTDITTKIQKTEIPKKIPAADAYQRGYELVVQKAKAANQLYNEIMENFCDYGNRALHDTMFEEMPEFFLRYDARFSPQEIHVLLAYPVLGPLVSHGGIDHVYKYLCYIREEQEFLRKFPEGYVQEVCKAYHEDYEELFISLSEVMMEKSLH